MKTLYVHTICGLRFHDVCAKVARKLGARSTHFRKEIWGASLRNSDLPQALSEEASIKDSFVAHFRCCYFRCLPNGSRAWYPSIPGERVGNGDLACTSIFGLQEGAAETCESRRPRRFRADE